MSGIGLGVFFGLGSARKGGFKGGRLMCGYVLARTDEQVWDFLSCVLGLGLGFII